jgi:hypothetical protein
MEKRRGIPLVAPPYVWTSKCPKNDYHTDNAILKSCGRPEYIILRPLHYGLPTGRGGPTWYRVGNDAVGFQCSMSAGDMCWVDGIVFGKFKQDETRSKRIS